MIVFDTLDNLELYQGISDKILRVITIMDRSLPYDQGPGHYKCPEDDSVIYEIEAYPTTFNGKREIPSEKEYSMEIVLEGEAVTSIDEDNVLHRKECQKRHLPVLERLRRAFFHSSAFSIAMRSMSNISSWFGCMLPAPVSP